jgi:hypothetical protein
MEPILRCLWPACKKTLGNRKMCLCCLLKKTKYIYLLYLSEGQGPGGSSLLIEVLPNGPWAPMLSLMA